ncbi:MAG TPA: phosphopantothenoylcysteine decarboxylase [Candidatus Saccharimonadales bacterium]|nr:phosphopantothenoylcysteine decarboxylase [Candidatus Saccharimonadales bacterium]
MKCIVTAGPSYEELDQVRRLTNFSTGALGSALADYLVEQGHEVELLRGHYSTCRGETRAQRLQIFTTGADLSRRLEELRGPGVRAVFHAAAVGDFAFGKIWRRGQGGELTEVTSPKISTRGEPLLAELLPTPKISGRLRTWFPAARLVGWKFEVEGSRDRVVAEAERQRQQNQTDACVANGPGYGAGFGLVTGAGQCLDLTEKSDLFAALGSLLKLDRSDPPQA